MILSASGLARTCLPYKSKAHVTFAARDPSNQIPINLVSGGAHVRIH